MKAGILVLTGKALIRAIDRYTSASRPADVLFGRLRRDVMPIKPSQYDVASVCNLKCEGCLYFDGDYFQGNPRLERSYIDDFFRSEVKRGVNYAHFGGAEPALTEDLLSIAGQHFKRGVIYTNGTIRIDPSIRFRLHISIWGSAADSVQLRAADVMGKALKNYAGDERAIFVITLNSRSVRSVDQIVAQAADHGVQVSFNHYSPTTKYLYNLQHSAENNDSYFRISRPEDNLLLTPSAFSEIRSKIEELIVRYPQTVVYDPVFNRWINNPAGIYAIDDATGWASNCASRLGVMMRHFQPDLTEKATTKCCTPNIDCKSCRLYAMAYASAIDRLSEFAESEELFSDWLSIADTWCRLFLLDWSVT